MSSQRVRKSQAYAKDYAVFIPYIVTIQETKIDFIKSKRRAQNAVESNLAINVPYFVSYRQSLIMTHLQNLSGRNPYFEEEKSRQNNLIAEIQLMATSSKHPSIQTQAEKYAQIMRQHFPYVPYEPEKEEQFQRIVEEALEESNIDMTIEISKDMINDQNSPHKRNFNKLKELITSKLSKIEETESNMYNTSNDDG